MSVSQTGRGNLPQILHATGPCPSAFGVFFVSKLCSMHFQKSGTHWYKAFTALGIGMAGFVRPDVRK